MSELTTIGRRASAAKAEGWTLTSPSPKPRITVLAAPGIDHEYLKTGSTPILSDVARVLAKYSAEVAVLADREQVVPSSPAHRLPTVGELLVRTGRADAAAKLVLPASTNDDVQRALVDQARSSAPIASYYNLGAVGPAKPLDTHFPRSLEGLVPAAVIHCMKRNWLYGLRPDVQQQATSQCKQQRCKCDDKSRTDKDDVWRGLGGWYKVPMWPSDAVATPGVDGCTPTSGTGSTGSPRRPMTPGREQQSVITKAIASLSTVGDQAVSYAQSIASACVACTKTKKRIGILGGSFSPVTVGHMMIAEQVLASRAVDEVWIVPCGARPDKPSLNVDPLHRYAMTSLAVEDHFTSPPPSTAWTSPGGVTASTSSSSPAQHYDATTRTSGMTDYRVRVMPLELWEPKALPSYVLMDRLESSYGHAAVFKLIIGMDLYMTLPFWQHTQDLLRSVHFLCVPRPGYDIGKDLEKTKLENDADSERIRQAGDLCTCCGGPARGCGSGCKCDACRSSSLTFATAGKAAVGAALGLIAAVGSIAATGTTIKRSWIPIWLGAAVIGAGAGIIGSQARLRVPASGGAAAQPRQSAEALNLPKRSTPVHVEFPLGLHIDPTQSPRFDANIMDVSSSQVRKVIDVAVAAAGQGPEGEGSSQLSQLDLDARCRAALFQQLHNKCPAAVINYVLDHKLYM